MIHFRELASAGLEGATPATRNPAADISATVTGSGGAGGMMRFFVTVRKAPMSCTIDNRSRQMETSGSASGSTSREGHAAPFAAESNQTGGGAGSPAGSPAPGPSGVSG